MNQESFTEEALKFALLVQEQGIMHTHTLAQLRRMMNVFEGIPAEGNKKARENERLKNDTSGK